MGRAPSDMQLAREIERQRVELHVLCGMPVGLDMQRGRAFLDAGGPDDVDGLVRVMRRCRERLDGEGWLGASAAIFWVATDEQVAEWKILEAIAGRVFDRLRDRITEGADQRELAARAVEIVDATAAEISTFSRAVGYRPVVGSGVMAWKTRHAMRLGDLAGPEEEREGYERAEFREAQRRAFEHHFGETLPPLGMYYTAACIAADLIDRYRTRDGMDLLHAIESAAEIIGRVVAMLA